MKKLLSIVMASLISLVIATGCNNTASDSSSYPSKSINGYIAWAAGGGTDNVMRTICPLAQKDLGSTIVLTNKTGGTGSIATKYVYSQPADGYSLLLNAENPPLYKLLGLGTIDYDNYIPVLVMAKNVGILVVPADSKYNSYQDLVDDAKAHPGKLNIATTGVGGLPYSCFALTCMVEGIDYNAITYDGDGTLQPALISGEVDASVVAQSAAIQYIATGKMKALGVYSGERCENKELADVPSLEECNSAYEGMLDDWGPFYGAFVKKGTPDHVVKTLQDAFYKAYQTDTFQKFCENLSLQPLGYTGDQAQSFIKKWQSITCWTLYRAGATSISPADLDIPEP
ncbi:MAG: tripartite tricarboxylate transporter substrate binding protein [Oscillospiraceae bacterium]|jgi:tripartite-type tricarboxylate transporter receptor subunit TctC|nr:tripartite tricarboxylate transporter substrate binding protein [Oscillospiraceae bacterium]